MRARIMVFQLPNLNKIIFTCIILLFIGFGIGCCSSALMTESNKSSDNLLLSKKLHSVIDLIENGASDEAIDKALSNLIDNKEELEFKISGQQNEMSYEKGNAILLKEDEHQIVYVISKVRDIKEFWGIGISFDGDNVLGYVAPNNIKEKINLPFQPRKQVVLDYEGTVGYFRHIKMYPGNNIMVGVTLNVDKTEPDFYINMNDIAKLNK